MRSRRFALALVASISLVAVACASGRAPTTRGGATQAETDDKIDFQVETFDGGMFSLAEQRGTPVVINFFESW